LKRSTLVSLASAAVLAVGLAHAGVETISGSLSDASNPALVGAGAWTGNLPPAPDFTDDNAVANNVALYSWTLNTAVTVRFQSTGYGAGGANPYFTLFSGSGPSASFVDSNYIQAFSVGGDVDITENLLAGVYTVALGTFANMSFAENLGTGSLGDGFIGLGDPDSLGNAVYAMTITTMSGPNPLPEPTDSLLCLAALAATGVARQRTRRRATSAKAGLLCERKGELASRVRDVHDRDSIEPGLNSV